MSVNKTPFHFLSITALSFLAACSSDNSTTSPDNQASSSDIPGTALTPLTAPGQSYSRLTWLHGDWLLVEQDGGRNFAFSDHLMLVSTNGTFW